MIVTPPVDVTIPPQSRPFSLFLNTHRSVASVSSPSPLLPLLHMIVAFRFILRGGSADDTASDTVPLIPLSVETKQHLVARDSSSLSDSVSAAFASSLIYIILNFNKCQARYKLLLAWIN